MKRIVLSVAFVLTLILSVGGWQAQSAGAVSCYFNVYPPITSGSYNYASGSMGCSNGGAYNTYKICIEQNGVIKKCNSARTNADSYIINTSCQLVGNYYTATFRTRMYIYDGYGQYVTSVGSGYVTLRQCY